jgi:hypothetical protein
MVYRVSKCRHERFYTTPCRASGETPLLLYATQAVRIPPPAELKDPEMAG